MTNNLNYKQHLPVVKLLSSQKLTSVTPHKLLLSREKYYQNKAEKEWEQDYYPIYNAFRAETD